MSTKRRITGLLATAAFAVLLLATPTAGANTGQEPTWRPQASDRLVKLPASYLKKTLDRDFAESALGKAITEAEGKIGAKGQTLADLQAAIPEADDDEVRMELRHQFLAEKRAYIELMGRRIDLAKKHGQTRLRLYEEMIGKLKADDGAATPARAELIKMQDTARNRFRSTFAQVDTRLFRSTAAPESKYAVRHADNMAAVEKLMARIRRHPMNTAADADGQELTKEQYFRQMLTEAQAELALLDQEDQILGYMAKLVAFDAMALSEEALDAELADSDLPGTSGPSQAVGFFLRN
ncbi:MAG: hypothetical protein QF893_23015 [Alphaproteobacteria bacterium]|jgi:hypothetical protein|nr:hypothetical protein [Alphaproteobacteria bacterium]